MAGKRVAFVWTGRILSLLVSLAFLMSASMKFKGGNDVKKGMEHLGIPESLVIPLAILEVSCVVVYAIPQTAVLGAILLTGYIGGAICSHLRVGDVFIVQVIIGLVIWLGLFLREERLWSLIPFRR